MNSIAVTESTDKRTKRGERNMNPKTRFVFNPLGDMPILLDLNLHRVLRTAHVSQLRGRSKKAINGRIRKLKDAGLVQRIDPELEWGHRPNPEDVLALTNKGSRLVAQELGSLPRRMNELNAELRPRFISHSLLGSDYMVRVRLACDRSRGRYRFIPKDEIFAAAPKLRDNIKDPLLLKAPVRTQEGMEELGTRPDDFFGIHYLGDDSKSYFFCEWDTGSMTQRAGDDDWRSNYKKYEVYNSYQNTKRYLDEFNIANFRVLFLTARTKQRARNLIELVKDIYVVTEKKKPGKAQWLFSSKDQQINPDHQALKAPWINGKGEEVVLGI